MDETAWRPLATAPRGGSWIQGRGASGIPRLMHFARKKPEDELSRIAAETLFGAEGPVWWAIYSDGREGSFIPLEWRPRAASSVDVHEPATPVSWPRNSRLRLGKQRPREEKRR